MNGRWSFNRLSLETRRMVLDAIKHPENYTIEGCEVGSTDNWLYNNESGEIFCDLDEYRCDPDISTILKRK